MVNKLETWYSELSEEQREIALQLREFVKEQQPQLLEQIKWNQPCFYGNSMVVYIQKAKGHVALGFGQGALLKDTSGILEGSGSQMRHVKCPFGSPLDRAALKDLVDQAVELDSGA